MDKEDQWQVLGGSSSVSSDCDGCQEEGELGDGRVSALAKRRHLVWFGTATPSTLALWARPAGPGSRPYGDQVAIKLVPSGSRELAALDALAGVRAM